MIPINDNEPITAIITSLKAGVRVFISTKQTVLNEISRYLSSGNYLMTRDTPLVINGPIDYLLSYKEPYTLCIFIYNGQDVSVQLMDEAKALHDTLHNN